MAFDSSSVDLRLLRPFLALAEEGHFTRAAGRLHTTQPALSQQIARLELQVGARLFDRPPSPIALTAAGEALLAAARPALAALDRGLAQARAAGGVARELTLGHVSSLGLHAVPAVIAACSEALPFTTVRAMQLNIDEQLDALRAGRIEAGLLAAGADLDVTALPGQVEVIARTPQLVAIPEDRVSTIQLGSGSPRTVDLGALADEPWILPIGSVDLDRSPQSSMFQALCARHGFVPRVAHQADSIDGLLGLAAAGRGLVALPWVVSLRRPEGVELVEVSGEWQETVLLLGVGIERDTASRMADACRTAFGDLLGTSPAAI